jgi:hypothetical protein
MARAWRLQVMAMAPFSSFPPSQTREASTSPTFPHVFIIGVLEGKADSYTHIAGRTGRFGKSGKIVTVAENIEEDVDDGKGGKKRVVDGEEKKMRGILRG